MLFFLCFCPTMKFQDGSPVDPLFEPSADPLFDSTSQKLFLSSFRRLWENINLDVSISPQKVVPRWVARSKISFSLEISRIVFLILGSSAQGFLPGFSVRAPKIIRNIFYASKYFAEGGGGQLLSSNTWQGQWLFWPAKRRPQATERRVGAPTLLGYSWDQARELSTNLVSA